jgi:glycosyltransferase involved in cell wall biosynthesis
MNALTGSLVSIITPSFNQGPFIEDCILSIKNQSYPNIEHIIIDGGSTDSTLEIIKKYEGSYNLRWISEPDEGQANAINKGFQMAQGDILAWLNCDDYYLNWEVLSKVIEYFTLYPSVDVIAADGYYVNKDRVFVAPSDYERKYVNLKRMRYSDYMLQPSTFWKKSIFEKVAINEQLVYAFDWLFFINIFEKGYNVLAVNDYLSAYRVSGENKTAQDNAKRKKEIARMAKRNFGFFSLQSFHCYLIYYLYFISEKFPQFLGKRLKRLVFIYNRIINKISDNRVYSC